MSAFGAGYHLFTASPLQSEKLPAFRASEILVGFPVAGSLDKLMHFQGKIPCQLHIFLIFLSSGLNIPAAHSEDGHHIERKSEKGNEAPSGKASDQGQNKSGHQRKDSKLISPISSSHPVLYSC